MRAVRRPECSVPDDSIPLLLVGPNKAGLWIVCESAGRPRGAFPDELSAMRFARMQGGACGCSVMYLPDGLDVEIAEAREPGRGMARN